MFVSFVRHFSILPCYTLSRLKGIETRMGGHPGYLGISCYTLSRLKGIETPTTRGKGNVKNTCYTLSRLKGIETNGNRPTVNVCPNLLYTFPFEGN